MKINITSSDGKKSVNVYTEDIAFGSSTGATNLLILKVRFEAALNEAAEYELLTPYAKAETEVAPLTAYRLLDVGEPTATGDEVFTLKGWVSLDGRGVVVDITNPIRRPDDGKGKWLLCDSAEGTQFWRWGTGWVGMLVVDRSTMTSDIWRKPREVAASKSSEASPGGHWVVVDKSQKMFPMWIDACKAAKNQAVDDGAGAKYSVCRVDRSFLCELSVVEKEAGK